MQGRKEGRKERRKERRREGRKKRRKELQPTVLDYLEFEDSNTHCHRDLARAIGRRPLIAEDRIRSRVSPSEIMVDKVAQ